MIRDKIDGRGTDTAADHTRAEAARMLPRQFHEQIQFRATVLQEVAGAFVALEQELAELAVVVVAQRPLGSGRALDFA